MMLAIISFQSKLTDVIYDKIQTQWINDLEISSVQENKTTPSKQRKTNIKIIKWKHIVVTREAFVC